MLAGIRKTPHGYEATYERLLPHPPEKVWLAVADGAHIRRWFTRVELEPRVGGRYLVHHDHVGITAEEEVLHYDPPHRFEHTWGKAWGPTPDIVRWDVHQLQAGTRLVVTYRFRDLGDAVVGGLAGWHTWLDILQAVLGGAERAEHEPPHGTFADGTFTQGTPGKGLWRHHDEVSAAYTRHVQASRSTGP